MVGFWGMGPMPVDLSHLEFDSDEAREKAEREYMERFERIGQKIMNRSRGMTQSGDPIAAILRDPHKAASAAADPRTGLRDRLLPIRHNREQVAYVADELVERKELFGDEVVELLESLELEAPTIDITDDTIWPKL